MITFRKNQKTVKDVLHIHSQPKVKFSENFVYF